MNNKVHAADVMITYSIGCAKCSVEHEAFTATDEGQAAREFNDAGWLDIDGDMTCPKCRVGLTNEQPQPETTRN